MNLTLFNKMEQTVNVGLIGTRFMGRAHSNAYLQASRFFDLPITPVLHTACGRDPDRLSHFVRHQGWKRGQSSIEKLVEDEEVQLIDICTPNNLHMPIAVAAAKAGKHVLCEKPLARNVREAENMYRAASEAGITHMMVSNYRFLPAIKLARKLIDEGKIGKIRHFDATYYQDWLVDPAFPWGWRNDAESSGSGAHGDMNAHTVDLARYLVGEFEAVNGLQKTFIEHRPLSGGQRPGKVTTDDATMFFSRFQNGAIGSFKVSRFASGRKNFLRLEIYGSEGSLVFNLERLNELQYFSLQDDPQYQGYRNILVTDSCHSYISAWWPPGHTLGWEHAFVHQVKALMEGIAGDSKVSPDFYDGLKCQEVLDAVINSTQKGTWVEIKSAYNDANA